jgi:hypothetical protein
VRILPPPVFSGPELTRFVPDRFYENPTVPEITRRVRLSAGMKLSQFQDKVLNPVMGWERNLHGYYFTDYRDGALYAPVVSWLDWADLRLFRADPKILLFVRGLRRWISPRRALPWYVFRRFRSRRKGVVDLTQRSQLSLATSGFPTMSTQSRTSLRSKAICSATSMTWETGSSMRSRYVLFPY